MRRHKYQRPRAPGILSNRYSCSSSCNPRRQSRSTNCVEKTWTCANTLRHSLTTRKRETDLLLGSRAHVLSDASTAGGAECVKHNRIFNARHNIYIILNLRRKRNCMCSREPAHRACAMRARGAPGMAAVRATGRFFCWKNWRRCRDLATPISYFELDSTWQNQARYFVGGPAGWGTNSKNPGK
jgi:hypothetical protein